MSFGGHVPHRAGRRSRAVAERGSRRQRAGCTVDGRYWFRHPLLAEVLVEGLLPEERRDYHAAFATALELRLTDDADVDRVVDLADHHFHAGHVKEAYQSALLGAEAAETAGGHSGDAAAAAAGARPAAAGTGPGRVRRICCGVSAPQPKAAASSKQS